MGRATVMELVWEAACVLIADPLSAIRETNPEHQVSGTTVMWRRRRVSRQYLKRQTGSMR